MNDLIDSRFKIQKKDPFSHGRFNSLNPASRNCSDPIDRFPPCYRDVPIALPVALVDPEACCLQQIVGSVASS